VDGNAPDGGLPSTGHILMMAADHKMKETPPPNGCHASLSRAIVPYWISLHYRHNVLCIEIDL